MQSADDLMARYEACERRLNELTAEAARNQTKLRRSQQRELRLLQAEDMAALIRELTDGLQASYALSQVSLVLCDPNHDMRHLLLAAGAPAESFAQLVMVESLTGMAPQYVALRRPWLGRYAACDHQLLFPATTSLASVAMIPLTFRRKLIGSINLGSDDVTRFTEDHAVDFLQHLGVIASFCVENAVNRARLLRSGFTDVLTGWHNRRYLQVRLGEELARARRDRSHLVCLMLDVDHFKRINDTWGHAAGDAVLRELANRIESQVRASDVAARYGGEEFMVLLPATDNRAGEHLAERIRQAVAAAPFALPGGEQVSITVSIGIAGVRPGADAGDLKTLGDTLIARADVAMYRAKSAGRDKVRVAADA
ncbi:MAG: sensor domain-containing diguanylate cyclase [Gammaproteobacteria bacterium]|nr:sensor domain-containing diguanylate cyclase [Gammaproteobacteria bacterium]